MIDPFAVDPVVAAWNLLLEPWQAYHVAGAGTPAELAAIGPLRAAAAELVDACDRKAAS